MRQAVRLLGGHVLEAVHGDIDLATQQARLDVFDEDALPADLLQRDVAATVAFRLHDGALDASGGVAGVDRLGDKLYLAQGEGAAARADGQRSQVNPPGAPLTARRRAPPEGGLALR